MGVTPAAHSVRVIPRSQIPTDVRTLLNAQQGVLTCEQASGLGVGRKLLDRLVRDGQWVRLDRGLYVAGTAPLSFAQRAWAGHLAAGPGSALGGAAALCRLGAVREPETIQLVVPGHSSPHVPDGYALLRDGFNRLAHVRGSLPVVRPEDALLDLAPRMSIESFVGALTDCTRHGVTSARRVAMAVRRRSRVSKRAELLEVLADLQGIESNLEFVFRRDVERAHGLPKGRRQVVTTAGRRIDVLYEAYRVIAELDGRLGHLEGRFRDFRRDNEHAVSELTTFRFGSFDVRGDPCGVADFLGRALEVRGWQGGPASCPRCRGTRRAA